MPKVKNLLKGKETEKNLNACSYLLKSTETETVYKIVYQYTLLEENESNIFWINGNDLEELVKHALGEDKNYTATQGLSKNDYLLTGSLSATKILNEPTIPSMGDGTPLSNVILEDENVYITQYLDIGDVTWKKMKNGDTSYWIDSKSLTGSEKTEENYSKWESFFYKVTSGNTGTGYTPEKSVELFRSDDSDDSAGSAGSAVFNEKMGEKNSGIKVDFAYFIDNNKEELSQLVHKRSTEWKEDPAYIDAFCNGYGGYTKDRIEKQQEKQSFWDDVSSKAPQPIEPKWWHRFSPPETKSPSPDFPSSNSNWYFHPINFIKHLNKVAIPNPYVCAEKIFYPGEEGKPTLFEVKNSPGFAPVYTWGDKYTVGGKSYAHIVGRFNEDYIDVGTYKETYTEYYHEGVDLRGATGTDIHSLIYAKVIAYGWYRGYGKTIILRNLSGTGVYLLGHLSEYMDSIDVGVELIPGQVVGKTGGSGYYLNSLDAHLHITYYEYTENERSSGIFTTTNFLGTSIKQITRNDTEYEKLTATIRDPFNHKTKKIADVPIKK